MDAMLREILPHIRAVWRYRWQALVLAWLVAILGWMVVMVLPDKYEANARVYVDTDSILLPLLDGLAVQPNVNQRISIMTQTLLSRPNIEKVVREVDLDKSSPEEIEDVIKKLAVDIRLVKTRGQKNLYTLNYAHNDPALAKRIVQALLNILVESTLGDTRQDSDSAQQFLTLQINEYEARLIAAEDRLMEFKRQNFRVLPSQEGGFFQELKQVENQIDAVKLEVREADFSKKELESRRLEFIESFKQGEVKGDSVYDKRLQLMQEQLDDKKLRYTEIHPDIIELKSAIKELERLKEKELQGGGGGGDAPKPEESRMYQELTLALAKVNAKTASLRVRLNEYQNRSLELKERVSSFPKVETDLMRLSRDYVITKKKYEELVERLELAKLSESADQSGDNVKFRVIDPPWVPAKPSAPNRILLLSFVLVGAIGVGGGFAVLIGFARPVVYDMYSLAKITDLSIYGAASRIGSDTFNLWAMIKSQVPFFIVLLLLGVAYIGILWLSMSGYRLYGLAEGLRGLLS